MIPRTPGLTAEDILESDRDVMHRLCNKALKRNKNWANGLHGGSTLIVSNVECPECGSKWHPGTLHRLNKAQIEDRFAWSNVLPAINAGETIVDDVEGDKRFGRLVPSHQAHKYGKWSGKV